MGLRLIKGPFFPILAADEAGTPPRTLGDGRCKTPLLPATRRVPSPYTTVWKALILAICICVEARGENKAEVEHKPSTTSSGSGLSTTNQSTPGPPLGIIIMAQGRSGSTMLGELFRQNKVGREDVETVPVA